VTSEFVIVNFKLHTVTERSLGLAANRRHKPSNFALSTF